MKAILKRTLPSALDLIPFMWFLRGKFYILRTYTHAHAFVAIHLHAYTYTYTYTYTYPYTYTYTCTCIYTCTFTCTPHTHYIFISTHVYVYVYIYTHRYFTSYTYNYVYMHVVYVPTIDQIRFRPRRSCRRAPGSLPRRRRLRFVVQGVGSMLGVHGSGWWLGLMVVGCCGCRVLQ